MSDLNWKEIGLGLTTAVLAYTAPPAAVLPGGALLALWAYERDPEKWRGRAAGLLETAPVRRLLSDERAGRLADKLLPAPQGDAPAAPTQPTYPAPAPAQVAARVGGRALVTPVAAAPVVATPMARIDGATIYVCVGTDARGREVYAPLKHGVIANSTGGGKTNLVDLIVGQLVAAGVDVWAGTPKYVPIDPSDNLPRHVIYDAIPASRRALNRDALQGWLLDAAAEVGARYQRMQDEPGWFPAPMVVVLDELKAYLRILGRRKDKNNAFVADLVNDAIQTILTLGRECGVFLVFTSQDGYCGSIEMSRGEIGNLGFRLVHPSLDDNSKKNLLPSGAPVGGSLGTYDWYCAVGNDVQVVTIPRVSRQMLGDWGLMHAPAAPVTDTTRRLVVAQPAPVADDPEAAWEAELFRSALAESSEVQALRFAAGRGKLTKGMALALFGGDEAAAFRALLGIGMSRSDIAALWKERKADVLERIRLVAGGTAEPDE